MRVPFDGQTAERFELPDAIRTLKPIDLAWDGAPLDRCPDSSR